MNLDELQSVQSRERQTDSLQQLRASFYEDAAAFVQNLRDQRERAAENAEDPFDSPDVNRLSDDIRTAEQTVEAIYERRVGKVVKMASLAAADMPTEREGLTKEEQDLFERMVGAIEDHQETILDVIGGEAPAGTVSSPPPEERAAAATAVAEPDDAAEAQENAATDGPPEPATEAGDDGAESEAPASASGEHRSDTDVVDGAGSTEGSGSTDGAAPTDGTAPTDRPGSTDDTDRMRVRITEDVGEIFGVDEREYDLAADDIVTLPVTNAEPLIDRNAAEQIE